MATLSTTFSQTNEIEPRPRTSLRGARLWIARAAWGLICATSLALYGMLLPLILKSNDYGDWTTEASAPLFGINIYSKAFDTYALFFLGLKYLALAVFVMVALYIFWRKSDDWLAILVSITLLVLPHSFNLGGSTENWFVYHYPWDIILYALDEFVNGLGISLILFIFFLFPDGRFVPRWTRWFAYVPFLFFAVVWSGRILDVSWNFDETLTWFAYLAIFLGLLLLVVGSQIYRYRRVSTRAQQAQTRIVVFSLVSVVGFYTLLFPISIFGVPILMDAAPGALATFFLGVFTPTILPLAFGVAMLRDQLWASDRVLNRAFVYGTLTVILLVIYIFIVAGLSELFRATNDFLIAAVATGVVALLFQPLRERLQRSLNRFLYGQRDEPFVVLNQLGVQLENTLAPDAALPLIVETIARTMRVPYAAIALTTDERRTMTEFGAAVHNPLVLPLRYQNETVGEMLVARRAPNENFSPADLQLLGNLARHAGAVAYTARLNAQLQQSRERIIAERENERRRLRRDLHDGLGPTLASQTLKLDAAMELLERQDGDAKRAREIMQELKTQTQSTVADIRRIVYELRPPALDDLGLIGALRAHLAQYDGVNGLKITFDAPEGLPPLSAAVQLNAYRIVLEAVTNVVKHARASHCTVRITAGDGQPMPGNGRALVLAVTDDGSGLPEEVRQGVGIASMRERAEELGGTFRLERNDPRGTGVIATLPLSNGISKPEAENRNQK